MKIVFIKSRKRSDRCQKCKKRTWRGDYVAWTPNGNQVLACESCCSLLSYNKELEKQSIDQHEQEAKIIGVGSSGWDEYIHENYAFYDYE